MSLITTYAKSHYRTIKTGETINWIDENLDPDSGEWLSRRILEDWGWRNDKAGYERGKDYNHSTFCDLVIRGTCGVEICEDQKLVVNPLVPENEWAYFRLDELPYLNHKITIVYDKDGCHYNEGKGLWVEIDGKKAAESTEISKLTISFS